MTSLAYVAENGAMSMLDEQLKPVRDKIRRAREHRRKYFEPTWQLNLAFASGQHWLGWHDKTRTLRTIQELDPRYRGRELITADVITEYRTTALGELGSDNDRPELLLRRDDVASEAFQRQLNEAVGYVWDHETDADDVLAQIDRYIVDLGTAAVRCRFDPTAGPIAADNVPHYQGRPVLHPEQAMQLMADGPNPDVTMGPVKTGRICWEPLSVFNLLVPPGAVHENSFQWEAIIRPVPLADVKELYGDVAAGLKEDNDISTQLGVSTYSSSLAGPTFQATDAKSQRVRDSIWLVTYYDRPSKLFPKGREITLAGNDLKLVDYEETLRYVAPDGTYRSGLAYFHWWRVTGRFWSRSLVDVLKDGQKVINKRRTQENEIIDRSLPYVILQKNSEAKRRAGSVNEIVEIDANERAPVIVPGSGPGAWMEQSIAGARDDLVHASGINGPRRGENPQNVTTYSQLSLINELDTSKREPIYLDRRRSIAQLVEDTIYDIRTYKGPNWQIALAGDDGQIEAATFNATLIPTFLIVEIGKGSAKPRSQAAEIQKITDLWNAAVMSTIVQQNPQAWIEWYWKSIDAGEVLELPASQSEDPAEKAEFENHYMQQGVAMPIAYYDVHAIHLPHHRHAQDAAMFTKNLELWQLIENHCQLHINAAQAMAMAQMAQAQPVGAAPGGAPGGAVGPGGGSPPKPPGSPTQPLIGGGPRPQ